MTHTKTHVATKTRFDLEQDILKAWGLGEDLQTLTAMYMDGRQVMSIDELWSKLDAIRNIHDLHMQQLWDTFLQVQELDGYYNPDKLDNEEPTPKTKRKKAKATA